MLPTKDRVFYEQMTLFRNVVSKGNILIEADYKLTAGEQKLLLLLASTVQPTDSDLKKYTFLLSDVQHLLGLRSKSCYDQIQNRVKGLMKKVFTIRESDSSYLTLSWLSSARYLPKRGIIELGFSDELKPYLLNLKGNLMTNYKVNNILYLRSSYSIRIYELLKQYSCLGENERYFSLDELRSRLGINPNELTRYDNFKRVVIFKALEEINEITDLSIKFDPIKKARTVVGINFTFSEKNNRISMIRRCFNLNELYPDDNTLYRLEEVLQTVSDDDLFLVSLRLKIMNENGTVNDAIQAIIDNPDLLSEIVQASNINYTPGEADLGEDIIVSGGLFETELNN